MRCDRFNFELPESSIATHPLSRREDARMLVVHSDRVVDQTVSDVVDALPDGAVLVVNDTRVISARLLGHREPTGGRVELLLVEAHDAEESEWTALGRASKPLRAGTEILIADGQIRATVLSLDEGSLRVRLRSERPMPEAIEAYGQVPLPPYIERPADAEDRERYQTVYAAHRGAVAAPTAGLHLSAELLERLRTRVSVCSVTLHVGLGTFEPVRVADLDDHPMHSERFSVPASTADVIATARAQGAPVWAVGTTVVRALESAADPSRPGFVQPKSGATRLLIQPGYDFRVVDGLLTNFHLPRSTLMALVCAFGGVERVLSAYAEAVRLGYRFYSYGDAMLVPRRLS